MVEKWPAAYRFLLAYQSNNDIQNALVYAVDVEGQDLEQTVTTWVDENQAIWQPWVDQALAGN